MWYNGRECRIIWHVVGPVPIKGEPGVHCSAYCYLPTLQTQLESGGGGPK